MSNPVEQDIAVSIYSRILNALIGTDGNGKPAYDPNQTYLTMEPVGRVIDPADYFNPWSPANSGGNQASAVNVADLVDHIPQTHPTFADTGDTVSNIYGKLVQAQVVQQPVNPVFKKQYDDAQAKLYTPAQVPNPDGSGTMIAGTAQTQLYNDYQANQAAYTNALATYVAAYNGAMSTPTGKNTWPEVGPTLFGPVKTALDRWRSEGAGIIEGALATSEQYSEDLLAQFFQNAQQLYTSFGHQFGLDASKTYSSVIHPINWAAPAFGSTWPTLTISQGAITTHQSAEATSYGASAGVNLGLWSFGGGASHSHSHQHMDSSTQNLNISFQFAFCPVSRPWMDVSLLDLPHWSLPGVYKPGQVSDGTRNQSHTAMPLLPMAFLAVRNVKISANWAKTDSDHAASATSASANVGWGPFSASGSYNSSASSATYHAQWDGHTLTIPTLQIIGWINKIVGYCPPKS